MSFPLGLEAQATPRLQVFGGYSYLRLTEQPGAFLKSTNLNGWDASVKLNVAPRIGLVADFSGHYGQRGFTALTQNGGAASIRQHTYLFGPEVRLMKLDRVTVNARALLGVAHTNSTPIPRFMLLSPNNTFATSFGGSVDYRISDRLSYRIVQPELFVVRSGNMGTNHWQQYNFRLSSGIVFSSGEASSGGSSGSRFSFGVIGGAALTDAFNHESVGFFALPDDRIEPFRSRSYSTLKDYAIGPMVEFGLPWRGLSVEVDALYRPMNLTMAGVNPDGTLHSISPATVVTWEFPALVKYRFTSASLKPVVEAGPSFRASGNLNAASPSTYGGTVGLGMETRLGKITIGPVIRYTHWAADPDFASSRTKRNQVELLVGLSF
jgi:hypothetical protein